MLAISSDDVETLRKFRDEYSPGLRFVSDPEGVLIRKYGVKTPLVTFARRTTFIIGTDGLVKDVQSGGDAIDAKKALGAARVCSLPTGP